jgi:hypothetical protein
MSIAAASGVAVDLKHSSIHEPISGDMAQTIRSTLQFTGILASNTSHGPYNIAKFLRAWEVPEGFRLRQENSKGFFENS